MTATTSLPALALVKAIDDAFHQKGLGQHSNLLVVSPDRVHVSFRGFSGMPLGWIINQINGDGWHLSINESQGEHYIWTLEPLFQAPVRVPSQLLHMTRQTDLGSIRREGIVPQTTSRTWTKRSYPTQRSFFATTLWDAFTYLSSHVNGAPALFGPTQLDLQVLADWELIAYNPPASQTFYPDAIMTGAVWTSDVITASLLSLMQGWREEYLRAANWPALSITPL